MALDVVVVSYKTPDLLAGFIESYHEYKWNGCTLTVFDVATGNDCYDSTEPGVFKVETSQNIGYARSCNAGSTFSRNKVLLLANADTVLTSDLRRCHDELLAHEDWGVLGPRQVNEHNQITAGGIFGTDRSISQRGWNETDNGQYAHVRDDAKSVSGSLYFVKRHVWDELTVCSYMQEAYPGIEGAFIPTPHYYEETCCSYHARAHGYKIVFYGPAKMIHYWHKASTHGGWADHQVDVSKQMMRDFCKLHSIICE